MTQIIENREVYSELSESGILTIRFNRPNKFNALNTDAYSQFMMLLDQGSKSSKVKVIYLTGTGKYFTSGNDLSNQKQGMLIFESISEMGQYSAKRNQILGESLINCQKPIVGAVNGPTVGVGFTMLAYCDFLFVEEKATFVTPFMKLAIGPEMGSSILFPKIFGAKKAMEILMLGHQLNAQQLLDYKFCNAICKGQEELHKIAYSVAEELASYDQGAIMACRELVFGIQRSQLLDINKLESENLAKRWGSEAAMEAITKFSSRKAKL